MPEALVSSVLTHRNRSCALSCCVCMFVYLFNSQLKSNYYKFPIAYAPFCFVEVIKIYIASDFYYERQFRALETLMAGARQIISQPLCRSRTNRPPDCSLVYFESMPRDVRFEGDTFHLKLKCAFGRHWDDGLYFL